MAVTIEQIKELREATAAGLGACKEALISTNGDMQEAIKYLREKGLAVAAKRVDKESKEGIIALASAPDGKAFALAEVSCETDFVAKTDAFKKFVDDAAKVVLEGAGILSGYIHMGGKIGVLVELGCEKADDPALAEAAHMLCLQIAANAPKYIVPEDVPQAEIDAELEIKLNALKEQKGKLPPEQALVGIKKGMAAKFCTQICLMKQDYVADGEVTVEKYLDGVSKTLGAPIAVKRFVRLQLGA